MFYLEMDPGMNTGVYKTSRSQQDWNKGKKKSFWPQPRVGLMSPQYPLLMQQDPCMSIQAKPQLREKSLEHFHMCSAT